MALCESALRFGHSTDKGTPVRVTKSRPVSRVPVRDGEVCLCAVGVNSIGSI